MQTAPVVQSVDPPCPIPPHWPQSACAAVAVVAVASRVANERIADGEIILYVVLVGYDLPKIQDGTGMTRTAEDSRD